MKVICYVVIRGFLVPSFSAFWYYYVVKIKNFSQFFIGMMNTLAYVALLTGSILYQSVFSKKEFRVALTLENFLSFFGGLLGAIFVLDLHKQIGLGNEVFYAVQSFFLEALSMSFFDLPIMVLFAKITPKNIEGTVFALLTGLINMANGVLSPLSGSVINDLFVEVTMDNLTSDNMSYLAWIETFMALLPLLFMWLIPLRKDVLRFQSKVEEEAKLKEEREE